MAKIKDSKKITNKEKKSCKEVQLTKEEKLKEIEVLKGYIDYRKNAPILEKTEDNQIRLKEKSISKDIAIMKASTGGLSESFYHMLLEQIGDLDKDPSLNNANAALGMLHGMKPNDEAEALLISQMFMTHRLIMRFHYQIPGSDNFIKVEECTKRIEKLLSIYQAQMESLQKYRGAAQQKVQVEHVHVHEGGQAIVGNVNQKKCNQGGGQQ